ncbi:uncharacterized protein J3D65DRAFT_476066 [Phyllosticta citribraziliensis]|uniref:Uncharacterized protein n=1 Tax=Phyllosticta citribraziliensis TaxID=989973 RepID=A0ABR1LG25_9PEZI
MGGRQGVMSSASHPASSAGEREREKNRERSGVGCCCCLLPRCPSIYLTPCRFVDRVPMYRGGQGKREMNEWWKTSEADSLISIQMDGWISGCVGVSLGQSGRGERADRRLSSSTLLWRFALVVCSRRDETRRDAVVAVVACPGCLHGQTPAAKRFPIHSLLHTYKCTALNAFGASSMLSRRCERTWRREDLRRRQAGRQAVSLMSGQTGSIDHKPARVNIEHVSALTRSASLSLPREVFNARE